jgi:hypothetical protein
VTVTGGGVVVEGGLTTVTVGGGRVVVGGAEIVVPGWVTDAFEVVVGVWLKTRVPVMVTAAAEIETTSATRFHFLKEITGGRTKTVSGENSNGVIWGGADRVGENVPDSVSVTTGATGTRILPVLVRLTKREYSVVVVVKTLSVETLMTAEDTTIAVVGNEVVRRALVIVVTGNEPVRPEAANTEMDWPGGTVKPVPDWTEVKKGLGPDRMLMGPIWERMTEGFPTSVHWMKTLFLPLACREMVSVPRRQLLRKGDLSGRDGNYINFQMYEVIPSIAMLTVVVPSEKANWIFIDTGSPLDC